MELKKPLFKGIWFGVGKVGIKPFSPLPFMLDESFGPCHNAF
jgi:hypothetical protein